MGAWGAGATEGMLGNAWGAARSGGAQRSTGRHRQRTPLTVPRLRKDLCSAGPAEQAHLDGEHHADKARGQQRDAQRLGPHQLQLVARVAQVQVAWRGRGARHRAAASTRRAADAACGCTATKQNTGGGRAARARSASLSPHAPPFPPRAPPMRRPPHPAQRGAPLNRRAMTWPPSTRHATVRNSQRGALKRSRYDSAVFSLTCSSRSTVAGEVGVAGVGVVGVVVGVLWGRRG